MRLVAAWFGTEMFGFGTKLVHAELACADVKIALGKSIISVGDLGSLGRCICRGFEDRKQGLEAAAVIWELMAD